MSDLREDWIRLQKEYPAIEPSKKKRRTGKNTLFARVMNSKCGDNRTCSICEEPIKPLTNDEGVVYWANGHNALPINDGRCCDQCNNTDVIPARIEMRRQP